MTARLTVYTRLMLIAGFWTLIAWCDQFIERGVGAGLASIMAFWFLHQNLHTLESLYHGKLKGLPGISARFRSECYAQAWIYNIVLCGIVIFARMDVWQPFVLGRVTATAIIGVSAAALGHHFIAGVRDDLKDQIADHLQKPTAQSVQR